MKYFANLSLKPLSEKPSKQNNYFDVKFSIFSFIFWLMLGLLFPLFSGNLNIHDVVYIIIFFFTSIYFGLLILKPVIFLEDLPILLLTGLSFIIGSSVLFIILSIFKASLAINIIAGFCVVLLLQKKISFTADRVGVAAIIPAIILLFNMEELNLAKLMSFENHGGDYFYFTAIVTSLSKTLTIYDSVFHKGFSINYSSLTFFSPAALSHFTGIKPNVCYNGIYVPILKILSIGILSSSIVKIIGFVKPSLIVIDWKNYLGASICLLFLAPLHPLYLAKLDINNAVFLGEGYLLPMGNIGFAFAMIFFGACNFFVFDEKHKGLVGIIYFIFFLCCIAGSKPAFYLPVIIFYGFFMLYRSITNKTLLPIGIMFLGFLFGCVTFKIFTGNDGGMNKLYLSHYDSYYLKFFEENAFKFHLPQTLLSALMLFLISVVLWLGLKIIIFIKLREIKVISIIIICGLLTIIFSALPGWLLKIIYADGSNILQDASFDTIQFLRAAFFVTTITAIVGLLLIWKRDHFLFKIITIGWFTITAYSLSYTLKNSKNVGLINWESEIITEYNKAKPKLMAMISNNLFSGQVLVANDITPWWICCERQNRWGSYLCTLKPNYRNKLLKELLSSNTDMKRKLEIKDIMIKEGLDTLIATPDTQFQMDLLINEKILTKKPGFKWFYELT